MKSRQYEHTLVLRLDVDEETLRRGLNSGHRSRINTAEKRGLRVVRTNDPARMPDFVRLLRQVERRNDFFSYEDPYFDAIAHELLGAGDASLYFATARRRRRRRRAGVRLRPDALLRVRRHRHRVAQADARAAAGLAGDPRRPPRGPRALRLLGRGTA